MAEKLETPKLNLKESIVSSSVFSGASTAKITPKISFGGISKAIGTQPSLLDPPKLDVPKSNPLAEIVAQLQVKFESLSSRVRANVRDIRGLKKSVEIEKGLSSAKEDTLIETNRILVEIQNQLALDFANRITEKKEKLDFIKESILKKRVADEEADLEKVDKKAKDTKKKITDKTIKPVTGIFDKIFEFLGLMGGAILAKTGFKWITDPENAEKIAGAFNWLSKHWKWIVGGLGIAAVLTTAMTLKGVIGTIWSVVFGKYGLIAAIKFLWPIALPIAIGVAAYHGFNALENHVRGGEEFATARRENNRILQGVGPLDSHTGERTNISMTGTVSVRKYGPARYWIGPNRPQNVPQTDEYTGEPIYEQVDIYSGHPDITPEMIQIYETWLAEKERLDALKAEMDGALEVAIQEIGHGSGPNQMWDFLDWFKNYSDAENQRLQEIKDKFNIRVAEGNYELGGIVRGPSHSNGGVPIEAEGGEYIIRSSEVNPFSQRIFDDFNYNGGELWKSISNSVDMMGDNNDRYQILFDDFENSIFSLNNELSNLSLYSPPIEEEDTRNWLQKFWDWFVPPAHLSNEPSVRAGVRTPHTGFNHVESMSGGSQLFGSPSTEEDSSFVSPFGIEYDVPLSPVEISAFRTDGPRINFSEYTFQGSEIVVPSNNTAIQTVERQSGSTGRIDIDPFDVTNEWRGKTLDIYGIGGELNDATS